MNANFNHRFAQFYFSLNVHYNDFLRIAKKVLASTGEAISDSFPKYDFKIGTFIDHLYFSFCIIQPNCP